MNKKFRRLASASLILGSALGTFAATVTLDEAKMIASEFLASKTGKAPEAIALTPVETAGSQSTQLYYVFNSVNNQGFVIVSAESSATPILGYSLDNNYPASSAVPESMQWMLAGIEREIKVAPSQQKSQTTASLRNMARSAGQQSGAKLLSTPSWSQEAPFNSMIPGQPLVGCVGTAMATVMKYYNFPESGSGSYGGVDFNVAYDWDSMRADNYRSGYTAAEGDAVATLMYHASKAIDTQYSMSGSSAYEVRVPGALSTYFGYDPGVSYKKRADVATQQDWDNIVKAEIEAGRPVIYCGQDVTAGHAFVCDGYEGEFLHFNWGWGGSANGYFLSTALNPTVSRTHHYNNLNTIVYNIKPGNGEVAAWSPLRITADGNQVGMGSDLTDLASGMEFKVVVGNLKNVTYNDFSGKIAVALFSKNGQMKAILSPEQNFTMQSMGYLFDGTKTFSGCKLPSVVVPADDDEVRIATKASGSDQWLPVAGELYTTNYLPVSVASPASFAINFPAGLAGVTIAGEPSVIRGWNYSFNVTPDNAAEDVVTVKANGYVLTPGANYSYSIANVREDQNINILVQKAADVVAKRSIWVETPGSLSSLISDSETGTIKELSLFGSVDARDFAFMRDNMNLTRVDLSGVYIAAYGSDQANALPREAFRGEGSIKEVILPNSLNRINNGAFRQCGITTITIPAGVKTYEYNVFVGATALRDIWVGRESAEFINWCVLSGVKVNLVTLHVPSERALTNYQKAENWNTIANIVVDPIQASDDVLFAVMDDADVKYESDTLPGKMAKGSSVSFTASLIPDNDNRMEVYANSTLLTPNADGIYTAALGTNTIIHFNMVAPTKVESYKSQWTLTDANGSIGLISDVVNVLPGQDFSIRVNALNIPAGYDQFYWAVALTDAAGNIKEFISPVNLWTAGPAANHKFNVNCCVKDSKVREGNTLRLVTSVNKRNWTVVNGANADIVAALPALNNQTEIYNLKLNVEGNANISGLPETAVRGMDVTLKITPANAANRVDLTIDGETVAQAATSVNYSFVVKADSEIDVKVFDPKEGGVIVYNVDYKYPDYDSSKSLWKLLTQETVCATVIVKGYTTATDLRQAFTQSFAQKTIKKLDLSGLGIMDDPQNVDNKANWIPSGLLYNSSGVGQVVPVLEEIILPESAVRIMSGAFLNCKNIKEITLPTNMKSGQIPVGTYASGSVKYGYAIGDGAFNGCDALTTIYIPGDLATVSGRQVVNHYYPICTQYGTDQRSGRIGVEGYDGEHARVTIVVPEKYLSVYRTAYNDLTNGNPWKFFNYNILSENPIYGVNFDASRIATVDPELDVTKMVDFLGDNSTLESIKVEGQLRLINPAVKSLVFDNGKQIQPNEDGTIDIEFFNPAVNAEAAGHHNITVINTYDLAFTTTSDLFSIATPEVVNDKDYKSGDYDTTDALAPVLKAVAENSAVKFNLNFHSEHEAGLEVHVMDGQQELTADAQGYYSVNMTNAAKNIHIFALPTNGATLNAEEIASIDPEQTAGITDICLTGSMTEEELTNALSTFPDLENLDLSAIEGELPEGALQGMSSLTTVTLPEVEAITPNMFNGCSSLQSVDIPASVVSVGAGAFEGCSALTTIRLTGVDEVGEGAFNGCDNLTTITFLNDVAGNTAPQGAPARKPRRSAGVSDKAFDGLNPNCFIVLDEGINTAAAGRNVLYTTTGMITESQPDGSTIEREGRVYTATSDVVFTSAYPLAIPHHFTLTDGASISLTVDNEKWNGLVAPFDVEKITDPAGETVEVTVHNPKVRASANEDAFYLFTLPEGADKLTSVEEVKANTPYLFHVPDAGEYTFSATGIEVASTPSVIASTGSEYTLHATYSAAELPAPETYLLEDDAYSFVPAGQADDDDVTVKPNSIYATSPVSVPEILTDLPDAEHTTAIDEIEWDGSALAIYTTGKTLTVLSPEDVTVNVYATDGRTVKTLEVKAGRNDFDLNLTGIYIVADKKVKF